MEEREIIEDEAKEKEYGEWKEKVITDYVEWLQGRVERKAQRERRKSKSKKKKKVPRWQVLYQQHQQAIKTAAKSIEVDKI